MPGAVYRVMETLCALAAALPVGTNVGLLPLLRLPVSRWPARRCRKKMGRPVMGDPSLLPAAARVFAWLGYRDSNPNFLIQSPKGNCLEGDRRSILSVIVPLLVQGV